jgi:DNA-3-methyladenine glycosylase II
MVRGGRRRAAPGAAPMDEPLRFRLKPRGAFSLARSATFGFGQRDEPDFDGTLRMAFRLDGGFESAVGVALRQRGGELEGEVVGAGEDAVEAVTGQVARVLSLDHDARGYDALAERDPVIAQLMATAPGLRPPLFYSPYEAAAWVVLSARRPRRQVAMVREALSAAHGQRFELAGRTLAAFPAPGALAGLHDFPGIPAVKRERLEEVATAARSGLLEAGRLRELGAAGAREELERLPGVGPFYSQLIVLRACGVTDLLPAGERHLLEAVGRLYRLGRPALDGELAEIAEAWRPWRTWASVLIRAAGTEGLAPLSPTRAAPPAGAGPRRAAISPRGDGGG